MPYNTQKLLTDIDGRPIPQYYDPVTDKFYPAGTMPVRPGANTPLVTTHQNAATANGNGVAADVDGYGSAMIQVTGTFNAKVNFEGSVDGVNYVPIFVLDSAGNRVASATTPGIFRADIAGLKSIRAPISNYVSGAVTVVSRALPVARSVDQAVQINGSITKEVALWNHVGVTSEVTVGVSEAVSAILLVQELEDGKIEAFAELATGDLMPLRFVSAEGNPQSCACERGLYSVETRGYETLHLKYTPSNEGYRYVTAKLFLTNERTWPEIVRTRRTPRASVVSFVNHYETPQAINQAGSTIYGKRDTLLRKSTDWGSSWTTVYGFVDKIPSVVLPTKSGRLVVVCTNGEVYTSDVGQTTFALTLTMSGGAPAGNFGYSVHDDICLLAEYNAQKQPPVATKVYMSTDAGQTWATILDVQDSPGNFHLHDVQYDPYEGIIWVCAGDGPASRMIFYSMDMGQTWHKVANWGKAPLQATSIIPLPECVLFVGDSYHVGVARYNRPAGGTIPGRKLTFERALLVGDWGTTSEVPIAGKAAINFANPMALFGWYLVPNAQPYGTRLKHANIYATKDGYSFFEVYRTSKPANGVGVLKGLGFDSANNAVLLISDSNQGAYPPNTLRLSCEWLGS